jgi:2-polyprenyl-3-methyl-5-hydroxy-6-metoxy-1,4-benzoquinol methylase
VALEKAQADKEAYSEFESECSGYCGAQDTFYLSTLKGVAEMPSNSFDAVTVVHMWYLIPLKLCEQFLQHCVRVLKPSGTLVLAVNIDASKHKYYFLFLQELIMVKLLDLTTGGTVRFHPLDECKVWIAKTGTMVTTIKSLDSGQPYSHAAVVAHKLLFKNDSTSIGQTL